MEGLVLFGVILVAAITLFLIFRNIVLWYWKVNTIVENQKKTINLLSKILNNGKPVEAVVTEEKAV